MKKLKINLKNCYGIKDLQHSFSFSGEHSTFSIYASNGSMKTSFAKTFDKISKEKSPEDSVYPERETVCEVKFGDEDIEASQVFVIHSYSDSYESEKIPTLLANKELRQAYEKIYEEINMKKNFFLEGLKKNCGITKTTEIEKQISKVFYHDEENKFFQSLIRIQNEIKSDEHANYKGIKYKDIFDNKIKAFLEDDEVKNDIKEYISKYDELLENSIYFKKGIFNHSQAEDTAKQLKKNGFFKAEHAVLFGDKRLSTEEELSEVINTEKENILTNEALRKTFDKLDRKITNESLRNFRNFLTKNPFIIAELSSLSSFESKLWKYYIKENQENFNKLLDKYVESKGSIIEINKKAKQEETKWLRSIKIFNERFKVPFEVTISNQVDVILEGKTPSIAFKFLDQGESKNIKREDLLEVLSRGEKRALYLLDIIFEIEARKTEEGDHLFIIDDIADSFDYKNKYAIIEYLKDMSEVSNFYQIILSHNFDFHRTVSSRLSIKRENNLSVLKGEGEGKMSLKGEVYQNNPFNTWRDKLSDRYYLIASIPFVRNLAEYTGNLDINKELTNFLHKKSNTNSLKIEDLKPIFRKILKNGAEKISDMGNFLEFLNTTADEISSLEDRNLEHKIVLAISIRLNAEEFMINEIRDDSVVNKISGNQTAILLEKYKELFSENTEKIKILEKVQLMTPESIHLNSFMYEPLLDMSDHYLVQLHTEVKNLSKTELNANV